MGSVRDVLVKASLALGKGESALDEVRGNLVRHGPELFSNPLYRKPYEELGNLGTVTEEILAELRVRLGPTHQTASTFAIAVATMQMTSGRFSRLKTESADPKTEADHLEAGRLRIETLKEIEGDRRSFDANVKAFFEAAHLAAGARLPA